jgi:hypothetical protein
MTPSLIALQIASPDADAIAQALGGTVVRHATGGRWVADGSIGELSVEIDRLRPAAEIVGELAAKHGLAVTERRSLTTCEGELAALATLADGETTLHVGVIFATARLTRITVRCASAAHRAELARLAELAVACCRLGSGHSRRRAYLYEPPPRWFAVRGVQRTAWYGPGHPRAHSIIEIADATPDLDVDRALASVVAGSTIELDPGTRRTFPLKTARGLCGRLDQYFDAGREHVVEAVCVVLGRFAYPLRMETGVAALADSRSAFERVVDSIAPLSEAA